MKQVLQLIERKSVDVVYVSVAKDTWEGRLTSCKKGGHSSMVREDQRSHAPVRSHVSPRSVVITQTSDPFLSWITIRITRRCLKIVRSALSGRRRSFAFCTTIRLSHLHQERPLQVDAKGWELCLSHTECGTRRLSRQTQRIVELNVRRCRGLYRTLLL